MQSLIAIIQQFSTESVISSVHDLYQQSVNMNSLNAHIKQSASYERITLSCTPFNHSHQSVCVFDMFSVTVIDSKAPKIPKSKLSRVKQPLDFTAKDVTCSDNCIKYLLNSTLHGLKYVGDGALTLFER